MNINRVILTGNLTRDPELRAAGNMSVCALRIARNSRRKNPDTQSWEDQPNYFDISVFGAQGENCQRYLSKGRPIAVDGRLRWREWEDKSSGQKRQAVDIIADTVQFLGGREDSGANGSAGNGNGFASTVQAAQSDVPIDSADFETATVNAGAAEEDIPF